MIAVVTTIELTERGDLMINTVSTGYKPHPAESRVAHEFVALIDQKVQNIIANSPHGGVAAKGPEAKAICDNVSKQYHREKRQ